MDDGSLARGSDQHAHVWQDVVIRGKEERASPDRPLPLWALLVAVAIHVALFFALRGEPLRRANDQSTAISVQLIDAAPTPAEIPAEPQAAPRATTARVLRERTPMSEPPIVPAPPAPNSEAEPALRLFNTDGSIALPSESMPATTPSSHDPLDAAPIAENTIMVHIRPLKVRPNHFEASWQATHGGNPLDRFVADHLTKSTGVMRMPWGTRVQCAWIVIVAGCAWGPPDYWHGDQSWTPATLLDEH